MPYYKVQVYEPEQHVWVDERGAFDTVDEAKTYIAERLSSKTTRIMVIERRRRYPLIDGPPS
jgi:hypothetical protein